MEKTPEYKGLERELKQGIFHQIYLLTGPEDYLRHYYRDRIREALMPGESASVETRGLPSHESS